MYYFDINIIMTRFSTDENDEMKNDSIILKLFSSTLAVPSLNGKISYLGLSVSHGKIYDLVIYYMDVFLFYSR